MSRRASVATPELNLPLIRDLVRWAELSQGLYGDGSEVDLEARQVVPGYEDWGVWNQGVWAQIGGDDEPEEVAARLEKGRNGVCGTAFCAAGQAAHLGGYRLLINLEGSASNCIEEQATGRIDDRGRAIYEDVPGAQPRSISEVGRETLGLTNQEASDFFEGEREVEEWKEIINSACQSRGLPPEYPDHEMWESDEPPW